MIQASVGHIGMEVPGYVDRPCPVFMERVEDIQEVIEIRLQGASSWPPVLPAGQRLDLGVGPALEVYAEENFGQVPWRIGSLLSGELDVLYRCAADSQLVQGLHHITRIVTPVKQIDAEHMTGGPRLRCCLRDGDPRILQVLEVLCALTARLAEDEVMLGFESEGEMLLVFGHCDTLAAFPARPWA